jgi:acetoin utilization protein AcuB
MRVKDLMSRTPVTIAPATAVLDAYRVMQVQRVRHLLVLDQGRLVGIVSDRDIRLNMPATTMRPWELDYVTTHLTVAHIMTRHLIVVESAREAGAAATMMLTEQIDALPVIDDGLLVGLVTSSDVVRAFIDIVRPVT